MKNKKYNTKQITKGLRTNPEKLLKTLFKNKDPASAAMDNMTSILKELYSPIDLFDERTKEEKEYDKHCKKFNKKLEKIVED